MYCGQMSHGSHENSDSYIVTYRQRSYFHHLEFVGDFDTVVLGGNISSSY